MSKKVVDSRFAKDRGDYSKVIEIIQKKGKCPFCPKNFKYHKKPILKKQREWFITESTWPYKNSEHHFLIIIRKHKEEFNQLNRKDFSAVLFLVNWAIKKYKIKGGGLILRFGDTSYTGATVCHLHFHLIIPKVSKRKKQAKVVNFPIG